MRPFRIRNWAYSLFVLACTAGITLEPQAQGMGGYGGGFGGYGGGGFGGYGGGGFGGYGAGGQGQVMVKYGEKIYDAVFGDLIDYKVYYIPMPADTIGVHYYDDGTNGDEVAYDGMPSNITINKDSYLGPFSIKYKKNLKKAIEVAEKMGALEFYNLNVATTDPDSRVTSLNTYREQLDTSVLQGLRTTLAQFEGYNDETYVKAIDVTLFDSLEGFGGVGGGFAGGLLPDLPPPPGMPIPSLRPQGQQFEGGQQFQGGAPSPEQPVSNPISRPIDRANQAVDAVNMMNSLSP